MQSDSGYRYKPLPHHNNSIRLLLLDPSSAHDAPLTGSLLHTTLAECDADFFNPYIALSYVWGCPERTCPISIDGQAHAITASLEAALRDLRDTMRQHRLWADALCINQDDIGERSRQVRIMGRIYATARNTVIYLGAMTPDAELIFGAVRSFSQGSDGMSTTAVDPGGNEQFEKRCREALKAAAAELVRRPWFRRVWVLQELVLSVLPWIQCGTSRVRWDHFVVYLFGATLTTPPLHQGNLQLVYHMALARGNRNPGDKSLLAHLLSYRRGLGVQEPVDMVFAHVGMASEAHTWRKFVRVDYSSPTSDVYLDVARYINHEWGIESLLIAAEDKEDGRLADCLPSWVPDWTAKRFPAKVYPENVMPYRQSRSEGGAPPCGTVFDSSILARPGWDLGEVTHVCPIVFPNPLILDESAMERIRPVFAEAFLEWFLFHFRGFAEYKKQEDLVKELVESLTKILCEFELCADKASRRIDPNYSDLPVEQCTSFLLEFFKAISVKEVMVEVLQELRNYLFEKDSSHLVNRRLAIVHDLYGDDCVIVPREAVRGDLLFLFEPANGMVAQPFLMRPVGSKDRIDERTTDLVRCEVEKTSPFDPCRKPPTEQVKLVGLAVPCISRQKLKYTRIVAKTIPTRLVVIH